MATQKDFELWLRQYNIRIQKCKWFIVKYFGITTFNDLHTLAMEGNHFKLHTILQKIWFALPDNIFNIRENPEGWEDFLYLIENYPQITNPAAPHDS